MRRVLIFIIAVTILALALFIYRTGRFGNHLQVDPHAKEEIEKAKQR